MTQGIGAGYPAKAPPGAYRPSSAATISNSLNSRAGTSIGHQRHRNQPHHPHPARLHHHYSQCRPRRAHHHHPTLQPFPRLLGAHNPHPPRHHLPHDGAVFDSDHNRRNLLPAYNEVSKSRSFAVVEPRMILDHPSWVDCEWSTPWF